MRRSTRAVPLCGLLLAACSSTETVAPLPTTPAPYVGLESANLLVRVNYLGQPATQGAGVGCDAGAAIFFNNGLYGQGVCDSVRQPLPVGPRPVVAYWSNQIPLQESVNLVLGQEVVRTVDLTPIAGVVTGTFRVNGNVERLGGNHPNDMVCAYPLPSGDPVCVMPRQDRLFRMLAPAGAGELWIGSKKGGPVATSVVAGQVLDVGDANFTAAAVRVDVVFNGQSTWTGQSCESGGSVDVNLVGGAGGGFCGQVSLNAPGVRSYSVYWWNGMIESGTLTLVSGQTLAKTIDLTTRAVRISGRVYLDGELAVARGICLHTPVWSCYGPATDANGRLEMLAPAGSGSLTVGGMTAPLPYAGAAGTTVNLGDLLFSTTGSAPGQLVLDFRWNGASIPSWIPGACIEIWMYDSPFTSDCGNGTPWNLSPGTYPIDLRINGEPLLSTTVDITSGDVTTATVDLTGAFGMLQGQVLVNGIVPGHEIGALCGFPDETIAGAYFCTSVAPDGSFRLLLTPGVGDLGTQTHTTRARYPAVVAGQITRVENGTTPSGSSVEVEPVSSTTGLPGPLALTFGNVTSGGTTTFTQGTVGSGGGPTTPGGHYRLGNPPTYYDIVTTAVFSGSVTVCLHYAGVSYANESKLRLLHYENAMWVDVTTSVDTASDVICGTSASLSPFLAAEENSAPVVTSLTLSPVPVPVNTRVPMSAAFTDANTGDLHTATINWDGVTSAGSVSEANGVGNVVGSHAFAAPGVYTVDVTVSDGSLAGSRSSAVEQPAYVVVYDPSGGFVTGGGWFDSPANACRTSGCAIDGSTIGRATFGFVSRYRKGQNAPDGSTEFEFRAGGLRFTSTAYQWLVVAGARAQFKGDGMVNCAGRYGFIITAVDGALLPGGGPDRFRIKIWDRATGAVVYDNQFGQAEDSASSTAIGGGSITIQK